MCIKASNYRIAAKNCCLTKVLKLIRNIMELESVLQDYIVYSDATESETSALSSPVIPERTPTRLKKAAAASPIYSSPSTNGSFEDAMSSSHSWNNSPGSFNDSIFSDVPTKDPVELDEFGLDLSEIDDIVALLDEIEIATPSTNLKIIHNVDERVHIVAMSSGIDPIET